MQVNVNAAVLALGIAIGAAGAGWMQPARAAGEAEQPRLVFYEYTRKMVLQGAGEETIKAAMNDAGLSGWELVEANEFPPAGFIKGGAYLYFRRPK